MRAYLWLNLHGCPITGIQFEQLQIGYLYTYAFRALNTILTFPTQEGIQRLFIPESCNSYDELLIKPSVVRPSFATCQITCQLQSQKNLRSSQNKVCLFIKTAAE